MITHIALIIPVVGVVVAAASVVTGVVAFDAAAGLPHLKGLLLTRLIPFGRRATCIVALHRGLGYVVIPLALLFFLDKERLLAALWTLHFYRLCCCCRYIGG